MSRKQITLFSTEDCNAVYQAIIDCADRSHPDIIDANDYHMYNFLENMPRSSLVAEIVNQLKENGWELKHTKQ